MKSRHSSSFCLLVFSLIASVLRAGQVSAVIPLPIEPGGVNVLLAYVRTPDEVFWVRTYVGLDDYQPVNGFNLVDSGRGDGTVFMQYYPDQRSWYLHEGWVQMTTLTTSRAPFLLLPVSEGSDEFTITHNGVPLVASGSSPRIFFYLQTRYPEKPPAKFRLLFDFDVAEAYNGTRANIVPLTDRISASTRVDRAAAYKQLIDLMAGNGHLNGSEVFHVGYRARNDFGAQTSAFVSLPTQTQLLLNSTAVDLNLFYAGRAGNLSIPMTQVTADVVNVNPLPYRYHYEPSNQTWAITYGRGVDTHSWYVNVTANYPRQDLLERAWTDGGLEYQFKMYMSLDLERFTTRTRVKNYWDGLYNRNESNTGPTTFYANGFDPPVYFYVDRKL